MKVLILIAALLALGQAERFSLDDPTTNKTCVLLDVGGSFDYTVKVNGKNETYTNSLKFDRATVLNGSDCTTLKLSMKDQDPDEDAQVWFDFSSSSDTEQIVSLITAFVPNTLFNKSNLDNANVIFKAAAAFKSPKTESYLCKSSVKTALTTDKMPENITITVQAVLSDFQVQSSNITGKNFSTPTECPQDKTPSPMNTTVPTPTNTTSAMTTPTTTMKPMPDKNDYVVKNKFGNITCINMTGLIAFKIKYETKEKAMSSKLVSIPSDYETSGSCDYNSSKSDSEEQNLEISFFNKTWKAMMVFTKEDNSYYVSEIELTYVYDKNLPDAFDAGKTEKLKATPKDKYLKANEKGYFTCKSNVSVVLSDNVTISTQDLKYRAFNTASRVDFNSDTVSECSQDEESNSIVPIAVGAALAGLVVIVLIAYLIGRRRSKKSGYESV